MKKIWGTGKEKQRREAGRHEREGEQGEVGTIYTSKATAGISKSKTEDHRQ
jgi:hypothetical protein